MEIQMNEEKDRVTIAARFIQGLTFGIELFSTPGVYLQLYLGIIEIIIYNANIDWEDI